MTKVTAFPEAEESMKTEIEKRDQRIQTIVGRKQRPPA
jgi:hypothetical protein